MSFVDAKSGFSGSSSGSIPAASMNVAAGAALFAFVASSELQDSTVTITDSSGNTWHPLTKEWDGNYFAACQIFYAYNCSANASNVVTASISPARRYTSVVVLQFSSMVTTSDVLIGDTSAWTEGGSTTVTSPGLTTASDAVLVGVATSYTDRAWTPGAGFTEAYDSLTANGSGTCCVLYKEQSGAGTYPVSASVTGGTSSLALVAAAFKVAEGSPPAGTSGSMAGTEGKDSFAASGGSRLSGSLGATEAADTAALAGGIRITGALAVTESADSAALAGIARVPGTLAASEGVDAFAASGTSRNAGALSATEQPDTLAATGRQVVAGILAVTEAQDTAAFAWKAAQRLDATEAPDTAAVAGLTRVGGALAATEAQDAFAASGAGHLSGSMAASEAPDEPAFAGRVVLPGHSDILEALDGFAATGAIRVVGAIAATEAADGFSAISALRGYMAATEAPDRFSNALRPQTPAERTLRVAAESRVLRPGREDRTLRAR